MPVSPGGASFGLGQARGPAPTTHIPRRCNLRGITFWKPEKVRQGLTGMPIDPSTPLYVLLQPALLLASSKGRYGICPYGGGVTRLTVFPRLRVSVSPVSVSFPVFPSYLSKYVYPRNPSAYTFMIRPRSWGVMHLSRTACSAIFLKSSSMVLGSYST